MNILATLFFISLLPGQLGAFQIFPNIFLYLHDLAACVLLFVIGIRIIRKKNFQRPQLWWPIVGFIGVGLLSLLANSQVFVWGQLGKSALYLVRWILYAGVYVAIIQEDTRVWRWGAYWVGVGFALMGFAQLVWYPDLRNLYYAGWDPHYRRLFGTLFDPNFMSMVLVGTFLWGIGLWQQAKHEIIFALTQLGLVVAIYLTYSRSGYLALVVGVVLLMTVLKKWRWVIGLLLFAILVVVIPTPGGDTLRLTREVSSVARVVNWQESLQLISNRPILGYGLNTLRYVPSPFTANPDYPFIVRTGGGVDSSILFVVATTGIIGGIVYLWLLVSQIRLGAKGLSQKSQKISGAVLLAIISAILVHSLFTNSLFYPWTLLLLWIYTGVVERGQH